MTAYSNPRMQAIIENWPHGKQRVTATFAIEADSKRGERALRTTTGATQKLTYARKDCGRRRWSGLHRRAYHVRTYHDHARRHEVCSRNHRWRRRALR